MTRAPAVGPARSHAPFAVANVTINPIVRAVLHSPVHRLLSRRIALITVTGRRSGRRFTFPVQYRRDGDHVAITVGAPARKRWWRNLRHRAPVAMLIQGVRYTGSARAHGDDAEGVTVDVELDDTPRD
jgi:F420H(2)-dependent quinone reductase